MTSASWPEDEAYDYDPRYADVGPEGDDDDDYDDYDDGDYPDGEYDTDPRGYDPVDTGPGGPTDSGPVPGYGFEPVDPGDTGPGAHHRYDEPFDTYDDAYGQPHPGLHQQGQQERPPAHIGSRRDRREAQRRHRARSRELRWEHHRLAIPYRTDGPKITFGLLWFAAVVSAAISSPLAMALVASMVAAVAGLQIGNAWFPGSVTRWWTALSAFLCGVAGFLGPIGIATGCVLGIAVLAIYLIANPPHNRTAVELFDVLLRSAVPVGIAAGSLAALTELGTGATLALVALVSAYEAGDFLVGSGSANVVEGPVSGLVSLGVVLFVLWITAPAPFNPASILLFGALAAVCCPLGQILGSAILPRGNAWAPALRRLDSYLLAAPLWLFLLRSVPTTSSL